MGVLSCKHFLFGSLESNEAFQAVLIFFLIPCCLAREYRAAPLIPDVPLLWVWNAPTENCLGKFDEPLDMSIFSLTGSPKKDVVGQGITIFYVDRLGNYPYIDHSNTSVNGGIPQLADLQTHLDKAEKDILFYMPTDNVGLAVIDWEEWRPRWARNWRPKDIYRKLSINLVLQYNPQLNLSEATKLAEEEFERTGKEFMLETLRLGKQLRPNHLWGYYLFPDCYNHNNHKPGYTGQCPDIEKKRNDALDWMWEESTALFPSIYLKSELGSNPQAALFVRYRVLEAIRVSAVRDAKNPLPVFIYTRLVFTDQTMTFLSEIDLVHTIGETVSLGVSGMVVWGALSLARSLKSCLGLEDYMKNTLNPYLLNVTLAAKICSQVLCKEQGVCTRKQPDADDYLHLNPDSFTIETGQNGKLVINGKPSLDDLMELTDKFKCACYAHLNCQERLDVENVPSVNVCTAENVCIDTVLGDEPQIDPGISAQEPPTESTITTSGTISPRALREGLLGCLLALYVYSQYCKYLLLAHGN